MTFELKTDPGLQRLMDAHPLLFRGQAPAVWSHVVAGWYPLVDRLCADIEAVLGPDGCRDFEVQQIKEKFGELRFYVAFKSDGGGEAVPAESDLRVDMQSEDGMVHHVVGKRASSPNAQRVRELVDKACAESGRTCEVCGARGRRVSLQGYITALCIAHERQRQEEAHAKLHDEILESGLRLHSTVRGRGGSDAGDGSGPPRTFDVGIEVSRGRSEVTLRADEFEEEPIARFLVHTLPELTGLTVRALPGGLATITDPDSDEPAAAEARPYALRIRLAGRVHPTTLGLALDGRWVVHLGDPQADDARRSLQAIEQLLRALHEDHKIAGLVMGIDDKGRPVANEGNLDLYAWLGQGSTSDDVERQVKAMADKVGRQHNVSFVWIANLSTDRRLSERFQFEPFFAWDAERGELIRRNWLPRALGVRVGR